MKKFVPFVTCEILYSQHVCELVFGVVFFCFGFLESRLIPSNNQPEQFCGFVKHASLFDL